jgi:hypothetical protein
LRKADVHVSVLNSRLGGAKLASIGYRRFARSRLPDRDVAERDVDMLILQNDSAKRCTHEQHSHRGAAQIGPIQNSGDRASVVQSMRGLMRQARQRVMLRD